MYAGACMPHPPERLCNMLEKYQSIIELYKSHNLEGIDMVNELMRFQALDQLVSSNAHALASGD